MTVIQRFSERDCERLTRGLMPVAEVHALGADNVRSILGEKGRTQYAHVPDAILAADPDTTQRIARYVMITESALPPFDRVILIDGIQLGEFAQRGNPLLFAHGEAPFPLGTMRNLSKEGMAGRGRKKRRAMTGDADFMAAEYWEFAALAWEMVQAGVLRGGSIGFAVQAEREPTKEEAIDFGIKSMFGSIATKINLVEFSLVPIGRDPAAQVIGKVRNHYARRLDALCAEGVCTRTGADQFLERVQLAAPSSTSYFAPPDGNWAVGVHPQQRLQNQAQEGAMCTACGNVTCDGGCLTSEAGNVVAFSFTGNGDNTATGNGDVASTNEPRAFDALQARVDSLSAELAALGEAHADLGGIVTAQRDQLRRLNARQHSTASEFREALAMRADPTYQPGAGFGHARAQEPAEVDVDALPEAQQLDVVAGALLARMNSAEEG